MTETRKYVGGQYGEDPLLVEHFKGKRGGFVVDVGAADGVTHSNAHNLLTAFGWSGVLVEPEPAQFAALAAEYAGRADVRCVNCAVGTRAGPTTMYGCAQVSTLSTAWRDACIKRFGVSYAAFETRVRTLTEILDEARAPADFDFLSIDAEGMDWDVLRSLDLARYRPALICMEGTHPAPAGYFMAFRTKGNQFYARA